MVKRLLLSPAQHFKNCPIVLCHVIKGSHSFFFFFFFNSPCQTCGRSDKASVFSGLAKQQSAKLAFEFFGNSTRVQDHFKSRLNNLEPGCMQKESFSCRGSFHFVGPGRWSSAEPASCFFFLFFFATRWPEASATQEAIGRKRGVEEPKGG